MSEPKPLSPVGIIIPTRWEASTFLSRYAQGQSSLKSNRPSYKGACGETEFLLILSGVGPEPARAAAYELCAAGARWLISAGFCGALVPSLKVGDLVTERITFSKTPARTRAEREALAQRNSAVAVDMETQAIVEAGTRRGVPIRTLRVVSDGLDDDLTPLLGASNDFSWSTIALNLLDPTVWPLALRLRRHSQIAKTQLADSLAELLKQPPHFFSS